MKFRLFILISIPSILSSSIVLLWIDILEYFYFVSIIFLVSGSFAIFYCKKLKNDIDIIKLALVNFPKLDSGITNQKVHFLLDFKKYIIQFLKTQKETFEHIRIQNELFFSLLNAFRDGVFCVDAQGIIVFQNKALSKVLMPQNSEGKEFFKAIVNADLLKYVNLAITNELSLITSTKIQTPKNHYKINCSPIKTNKSESLKLFILINKTKDQKLKKDRQEFLQNASHELKTPVTSIRGYAETLLQKETRQPSKRFLNSMLRNTIRMERIIEDMVTISSIESGGFPFLPESINMNDFFENILELVKGIVANKSQQLEFQIAKDSLNTLKADPLLLEHLLLNLIANASRYSPENTKIIVSYDALQNKKPLLKIIDQGSGILPEHRKKVFTRFYRIDANRSRQGGGTGLGLSIVKNIVRLHRGRIWVEKNNNGGSIFLIKFPKAKK